ncbi:MAG: diguanylate cyclase (GGDEF)-like protein [Alcanivorax sp.]|jgi:diguanylate cyclase (GGDEF)-like protein
MTIKGKVNSLVISIALLSWALFAIFVAQQTYNQTRTQLVRQIAAQVASQPQLQVALYYKDLQQLRFALNQFLTLSPAVRYALMYDTQKETLSRVDRLWSSADELPSFSQIRDGAAPTEQASTTRAEKITPPDMELIALVTGGESVTNLTIPVFSAINPLVKDVTRGDFGIALTDPSRINSLFVVGYVNVAISSSLMRAQTLSAIGLTLLPGGILVIIFAVLANLSTRRITRPLSQLSKVADGISSGNLAAQVAVKDAGELQEIADVLNSIIGGINTYKTKMDVDHQLLSMKVEERTVQLSRRNDELNKAVDQVTQTKNRLRELAYFDSLTSLPNRRLFTEQLNLLLRVSTRNKQPLALLFLDLDNFKRINDSLGHSAGDTLLQTVADRLSECIRDSDLLAHFVGSDSRIDVSRLGGDEFTVVLNQVDSAESAGIVAQRLIDALTKPVEIDGHELVVTPSIGIAVAPRDATDVEGLLKAADIAMYHAKKAGKSSFLFYETDMDGASVDKLRLETDLRKAIELNQLVMHYQPQVDTRTGTVIGAEALIRWQHPQHGLIPPFKFIALAEELGLIGNLGEWGLREACRELVEIRSLGLELSKVSVNVSALQFNSGFIGQVAKALQDFKLEPGSIELELTEGIMMDDKEATIHALEQLKEMGIRLSIDDFGTGYSSLSYLSRFPLDELKIDRSFVVDIDKSENDASLVVAIIAMAKSMNLELVAEGVETLEQYHFLTRNGAGIIQGFIFSKPVPLAELKPLLIPAFYSAQIQQVNRQIATLT